MNRPLFRALILVGALVALAVPVVGVTQSASACSNIGCTTSTSIPSQIDTFVSPIRVSMATAFFTERATSKQVGLTETIELTGTVGFTVLDARGNDQGWTATLMSTGFSSSLFPLLPISGDAVTVSGLPSVTMICYGPFACSPGIGIMPTAGLGTPQPVAGECFLESMGEGQYAVTVPLVVTVKDLQAEKLGSYPASWFGNFVVSVNEGPGNVPC